MVSSWLNIICNENEILINVDYSQVDLFEPECIDQKDLETQITKIIHDIDESVSVSIHFIKSQNLQMIEIKCNCSNIDSDDISFDEIKFEYKSDEKVIELVNEALFDIALEDRISVENFLVEHETIRKIIEADGYQNIKRELNTKYLEQKLIFIPNS